jgi:hypothetical protein
MKASTEGGQGPEGATVPRMDGWQGPASKCPSRNISDGEQDNEHPVTLTEMQATEEASTELGKEYSFSAKQD